MTRFIQTLWLTATIATGAIVGATVQAAPAPAPADKDPAAAAEAEATEEAEAPSPDAPAAANPDSKPEAVAPTVPAKSPLRVRAENLLALAAGTLDPSVDARTLLVLDLTDPAWVGVDGARITAIILSVSAPPTEPPTKDGGVAAGDVPPPSIDELDDTAALEAAYSYVLRLPPERRQQLVDEHTAKQQRASESQEQQAAAVAATTATADQLAQYLAGTLDVTVDPQTVLRLDLGHPEEIGLSAQRRTAWIEGVSDTPRTEAEVADDERTQALAAARLRLDTLRRQYLKLPIAERDALMATHKQRQVAAAEPEPDPDPEPEEDSPEELETAQVISDAVDEAALAASQQAEALEAARRANTEAKRIVAEERARLLGLKQEQALYEADINRRRAERGDNHDKALEWSRRVGELAGSTKFESEKAAEADPMYDGIREDLSLMRDRLRGELQRIRDAGSDVPTAGEGLDKDLPADVDRADIADLRAELDEQEKSLTELEQSVSWELAQGLRDDVVLLNRTRLELLDMATPTLRSSVTGFGTPGVDQVSREFDQISVELSFHALKVPRYRHEAMDGLSSSGIPLLIGLMQLAAAFAAFIWWRRNSPSVLGKARVYLREHQPNTRVHQGAATALWYLERVRRPLEILTILWVVFALIGDLDALPEFELLWIIALWVLLGLAVILFVDALAARETLYSADTHDTSELRIHSLRLVGLNVIAVGLVLSLTSAMVGKGAIYSWVISTCWILSFPVALYLVHKWRPIIFDRVEQRAEQGPFTKWVVSKKAGVASFLAATSGAIFLLSAGLGSWIMRQLSGLEATRRLLAYLFRREVAKQAAATHADGRFTPINREVYDVFAPERIPPKLLGNIASAQVKMVADLILEPRPTLSAVIGERGAGKSVFIKRVAEQVGADKVHVLSCPEEGFDALQGLLAEAAGAPTLRGPELCTALRGMGHVVFAIDDIQRLVIPAVNGLRGLDKLTSFAREVGGEVSWVVAIGSASWHYVRRARGERVFFEQLVEIPHWSEDELSELIQSLCDKAKIDPSFEGLVVPRQNEAPLPNQGDRTKAGYYRLLWDFSNGNPAVALHAFRESLFINEKGEVVVRLFKEPPPSQIEDLSMPVLFVLRSIVQLELAMPEEVESATQLPKADIDDAIRFCLSRGYLEPFQGGVRLSWPWYRTITTVLQRQHLLSSL